MSNPIYSAPSKMFLIGEYLALLGEPSWICAMSPRFLLKLEGVGEFPRSLPIGIKLGQDYASQGAEKLSFSWLDPWGGKGGFGASSAQFALTVFAYHDFYQWKVPSYHDLWASYQRLEGDKGRLRSGGDLVAQWCGGIQRFQILSQDRCETFDVHQTLMDCPIYLFSATDIPGRKIETHTHLDHNRERILGIKGTTQHAAQLSVLKEFENALDTKNWAKAGFMLTRYAEELYRIQFELPAATADREAIARLPGVLGLKGCGALLADGLVVMTDGSLQTEEKLIQATAERGLRFLQKGLEPVCGVRRDV